MQVDKWLADLTWDRLQAVVEGQKGTFHFHDTRHTWVSLLMKNGVPKGMIKELGGWKSDKMVERYAALGAGTSGAACGGIG